MNRGRKAATEQEKRNLLQQEAAAAVPEDSGSEETDDRVYVPMSGRRIAVLVALVLIAGITLGYAGFYFYTREMREKIYTQLQKEVAAATATTPVPTAVPITITMAEETEEPEGNEGTIEAEDEPEAETTPEPTPILKTTSLSSLWSPNPILRRSTLRRCGRSTRT